MRRRAGLLAIFVGLSLTLMPVPGLGAQEDSQPVVEASRLVTDDPNPNRLYSVPQVAVHPDDPNTVVVASGDYRAGGCHLYVSVDGGLSFANTTRSLLPESDDFCIQRPFGREVAPMFNSEGTLYIAFSGARVDDDRTSQGFPNGPQDGYIARTDDLGLSHERFLVQESEQISTTNNEGVTQEAWTQVKHKSLAINPTNEDVMYVGWRETTSAPEDQQGFVRGVFTIDKLRSKVAVSTDGGETWGEPFDLTDNATGLEDPPFATDIPELEVGPDGTVYAFTKERAPGGGDGPPPANRLFMYKSTDQGQSWVGSVIHPGSNRIDTPDAGIDAETGDLYVVWNEQGDSRDLPSTVYFMTSEDGGETWTDPISLIDPDIQDSFNQYQPGISVAPNGRIDVAWFDFRDDPFFSMGEGGAHSAPNEVFYSIYMTYSNDGGRTWATNLRVSDHLNDANGGQAFPGANRGPIGVASTEDSAYVVWPDTRAAIAEESTEDAYLTKVRFASSALPGAGTDGSAWLWAIIGAGGALAVAGLVLLGAGRREPTPA